MQTIEGLVGQTGWNAALVLFSSACLILFCKQPAPPPSLPFQLHCRPSQPIDDRLSLWNRILLRGLFSLLLLHCRFGPDASSTSLYCSPASRRPMATPFHVQGHIMDPGNNPNAPFGFSPEEILLSSSTDSLFVSTVYNRSLLLVRSCLEVSFSYSPTSFELASTSWRYPTSASRLLDL
ncbi:hypothetical protein VTN96DRAFT_1256 [Rasamsonia emersonii]